MYMYIHNLYKTQLYQCEIGDNTLTKSTPEPLPSYHGPYTDMSDYVYTNQSVWYTSIGDLQLTREAITHSLALM